VVFLLTEFPLRQQKSVSFTFRCALIFVDTYAHTLFLEVNSVFHLFTTSLHISDFVQTQNDTKILTNIKDFLRQDMKFIMIEYKH
jgi:hypothetical protein